MRPVKMADIKRGDTFSITCVYKEDNVPADTASVTIRSMVRQKGTLDLFSDLVVFKDPINTGVFTLTATSTALWKVGKAQMDIEFTKSGIIASSVTIEFDVIQDITYI